MTVQTIEKNVKSWTIFEDQFGIITVKVKFIGQNGSQNGLNIATGGQNSQVSYVRKSVKQIERNRKRAQSYQQQQVSPVPTRSKSKQVNSQESDLPRNGCDIDIPKFDISPVTDVNPQAPVFNIHEQTPVNSTLCYTPTLGLQSHMDDQDDTVLPSTSTQAVDTIPVADISLTYTDDVVAIIFKITVPTRRHIW